LQIRRKTKLELILYRDLYFQEGATTSSVKTN